MPDGRKVRASVACKIRDDDAANHQKIKFLVEISSGEIDEVIAYNELSNIIEDQHNQELNEPESATFVFKAINEHQGRPLNTSDHRYKGSSYNVLVHWEDGSEIFKPLTIMVKDDPLTCTLYAKAHDLLDTPGWKSLKRIATREVKFTQKSNQPKSNRHAMVSHTNLASLSRRIERTLWPSMHPMRIKNGRYPWTPKWNKSMNMTPLKTLGRENLHLETIKRSEYTSSTM
jgi:hypothetical protein